MTDHRTTDLSYGHLGEASYDADEKSWHFSSQPSIESFIEPLQPLQEYIPPSQQVSPKSAKTASKSRQSQERWLRMALPEAGPAKASITSMIKAEMSDLSAHRSSSLLAIGRAADIDHMTGTRSIQIMGMVHGEAGNLLRLVKPRIEGLKWDSQHDTKLRSVNPIAGEECYWAGSGGAIQQITFGADGDGSTSWLAVLKEESITILRPVYRRVQTPSLTSIDVNGKVPPSRLNPNPILSLNTEQTSAKSYTDVSFNPWYIRQFAVMDQQGYWSVWDVEGQKRKRTTFKARPGRSGHIQDDLPPGQGYASQDSLDGWGRVLWAGSVSTIIVCNRRSFSVFDLKAAPKRLHSPEIVHPNSIDWILDIKRSPVNLNQIFVLTTKQVFWLEIAEADENRDKQFGCVGAKILLSCQHFRNQEDETAKLELLGEMDGCTVLLYSAHSPLVNTYRFSMALGEQRKPICSQGSFILEPSHKDQIEKDSGMVQTLCLLSTTFMLHNLKPMSGPAKQYADHNVRFYQLFGLSARLGLYHTLCAARWISLGNSSTEIKYHNVLAPTIKDRRVGKMKSSVLVVEDQFIVPDGFEDDSDTDEILGNVRHSQPKPTHFTGHQNKVQHNLSLSINARRLFKASFGKEFQKSEGSVSPKKHQTMVEYSKAVQSRVEEKKNDGIQGLFTILDLVEYTSFSEDIDEVASTLRNLIDALSSTAGATDTVNATPLAIRPSPLTPLYVATASAEAMPDLSDIYDKLIGFWVSSLPRKTPGPTRLAKEKLVRSVAAELCLSSLGVFIRDKSITLPKQADPQEDTGFVLPVRNKPNSPETMDAKSTQNSLAVPVSSLPTPTPTPSLPSNDSTASLWELAEDEAIARLRGYTLSIKSQPPLGASRSEILAHWPSAPGADPSKYSWEVSRQSLADGEDINSDQEEALARQREQDRCRRRTEKFLKRQRVNTIDTASQSLPAPVFGSQPDPTQHLISSQNADVPMTQPDRGAFGSRLGPKGLKKRRTMGF